MKILLITDTLDPEKGGAEKFFFKLKDRLQARQDLEIFALGFGPKKIIEKHSMTLPETSSKFLRHCWRMFFNPIKYFSLRSCIRRVNPDVIHLHNINKYTLSLLKAVKGFPLIQTTHDFSFVCPTQWNLHSHLQPCLTGFQKTCWRQHKRHFNYFYYILLLIAFLRKKKLLKNTIHEFIAPSNVLKNYLTQQGFKPVSLIPPFVQKNPLAEFEKMQGPHFLFIGQLEKQKGTDLLIDEFAMACHKNKNLILKIVGRGSLKETLIKKVNQWGLVNNVFFIDWVSDPSAYYQACSAVIFPSMGLESFGLVITEAMTQGRMIIGSKRGPTVDLIEDGKTGLLFDPLQKGQLAEKILLIAEHPELAQEYGRKAWEKMQGWLNDHDVVEEILKIYRRCYNRKN